jgi:hypothetical protein
MILLYLNTHYIYLPYNLYNLIQRHCCNIHACYFCTHRMRVYIYILIWIINNNGDEWTVNIKIKFYLTLLTCASHPSVKKNCKTCPAYKSYCFIHSDPLSPTYTYYVCPPMSTPQTRFLRSSLPNIYTYTHIICT